MPIIGSHNADRRLAAAYFDRPLAAKESTLRPTLAEARFLLGLYGGDRAYQILS
ncbi:hypothetical protein [Pseudochelatococcus sp. G4_1912]|uniref:hypothetical protein n=1 Tax=Pseudochelatococcus sp. G4_1912 TaxID=3114288 RepID=UPI0039C62075